jgi:predicted dehydrogenase
VSAADRAGVRLMVGYLLRFDPLRRRLKGVLDVLDAVVLSAERAQPVQLTAVA